jgi:methionine-rich copper-binding protein CopC
MKTRVLLLMVLSALVCSKLYAQQVNASCGFKRYIVPMGDNGKTISGNPSSMWYYQVNPGDTLVLSSQYNWNYFRMEEYSGTAACPIVVINEGGQVWFTGGINAESCKYVKFTGSGHPNTYYGFRMYNPGAEGAGVAVSIEGKAKNIEIDRIDVYRKAYGVWAKQDPKCDVSFNYPNYVMDSIEIHHSRFKNIYQDCIYAGNTDPAGERTYVCNGITMQFIPMRLGNVSIHHLLIDSCNRTGIQLSGSDHGINKIYDNRVTNCGYEYNQHQGTGISIGGMTSNCYVYNNTIKNTFLYGIFDLGAGEAFISNNNIDSSGYIPISPFINIDSLASATGLTYSGRFLKNNFMNGITSIQTTTKPTVPITSKTVYITKNKLGINSSTAGPEGIISFSQWGPAVDWTSNNKVCENTRKDGVTPVVVEKFWFIPQNQYWPLTDTACSTVANIPPAANAGSDTVLTLNSVTLQGAGTDVDGTIVSYEWTKIGGPEQVAITNALQAQVELSGLEPGVYTFRLTVTDNNGATGTDDVRVFYNAPNINPVAFAGLPMITHLPKDSILLMGSAIDVDGTIQSFAWTKIAGPATGTITDPSSAHCLVQQLSAGLYKFELKVTDNSGGVSKDTVDVHVNLSPVVNAGADIEITLPVNSVVLNGTAHDADGFFYTLGWTKIEGPAAFSIVSPAQPLTSVNTLEEGIYKFELKAMDNHYATTRDTVVVTVHPSPLPNVPPTASAGADQTITLPVNAVTLNGSGVDTDGTIASYAWTKTAGPASFTIVNANAAQTSVTGLVQGTYTFKLIVTDNNGATASATVNITVLAAAPLPNVPPTASAGADQTITLPVNAVTLNGSGVDTDGTIASYAWTKTAGPASFTIVNANAAQTSVTGLVQGTYTFKLIVTDNNGATASASVNITVLAAAPLPNVPPTASAGADQTITLPVNAVTLNGSGADTDGTIVSYAWTKTAGPASFTIVNGNAAQTSVTGLTEGTYTFQLKVTDNSGASATALVNVTVNKAAPVATNSPSVTIAYPNPAYDEIRLNISEPTEKNLTSIRIFDSNGQLVYNEEFLRTAHRITRIINIARLKPGSYFIEYGTILHKKEGIKFLKL